MPRAGYRQHGPPASATAKLTRRAFLVVSPAIARASASTLGDTADRFAWRHIAHGGLRPFCRSSSCWKLLPDRAARPTVTARERSGRPQYPRRASRSWRRPATTLQPDPRTEPGVVPELLGAALVEAQAPPSSRGSPAGDKGLGQSTNSRPSNQDERLPGASAPLVDRVLDRRVLGQALVFRRNAGLAAVHRRALSETRWANGIQAIRSTTPCIASCPASPSEHKKDRLEGILRGGSRSPMMRWQQCRTIGPWRAT